MRAPSGIASPAQPVRVAVAVPALVVVADDPPHAGEERHGRAGSARRRPGASRRLELLASVERPGLVEDGVGDGDLADVVEDRAVAQVAQRRRRRGRARARPRPRARRSSGRGRPCRGPWPRARRRAPPRSRARSARAGRRARPCAAPRPGGRRRAGRAGRRPRRSARAVRAHAEGSPQLGADVDGHGELRARVAGSRRTRGRRRRRGRARCAARRCSAGRRLVSRAAARSAPPAAAPRPTAAVTDARAVDEDAAASQPSAPPSSTIAVSAIARWSSSRASRVPSAAGRDQPPQPVALAPSTRTPRRRAGRGAAPRRSRARLASSSAASARSIRRVGVLARPPVREPRRWR